MTAISEMTTAQMWIIIGLCVLGTVLTRFLPYVLFPEGRKIPKFVGYLEKYLAPAVFGLLVVYCLRNVSFVSGSHGIPELIAIAVTVLLYLWKHGMMLPMAGGTIVYMLLLRYVF